MQGTTLSLFLTSVITVGHHQLFYLGVGRPEQWRSEDYWVPYAMLTEGPVVPIRYMTTFYKILEVCLDNIQRSI